MSTKNSVPSLDLRKMPLVPPVVLALGIGVTEAAVRRGMRDLDIEMFRTTARARGLISLEHCERIYRHLRPGRAPA